MKHKFCRVLTALLLTCTAPVDARPAPPAAPIAHPALWRVTRGHTTIYLFGTIHAWPKGGRWFAGPVAQAFAASDALVTEIPDMRPQDMESLVAAKALLPAGDNLRAHLPTAERRKLEATLVSAGLPKHQLDPYQPWYAAVSLVTLRAAKAGFDPDNGIDEQLAASAKAGGKRHEALETAAFQLGLFAGLPKPTQYRYLAQVLPSLASLPAELAAMAKAWQAGDAARLARLVNADDDTPELRPLLLTNRNITWAHWIDGRLHAKNPHETLFMAVGAGHLAGSGSVLEDLRALGINAVRVQ